MLFKNKLCLVLFLGTLCCLERAKGQSDSAVECPLVWQVLSNGDKFPQSIVPAHQDQVYIVSRGSLLGSYLKEDSEAYFPSESAESNSTSATQFSVLTNPHGCILEWKPQTGGSVPASFTTSLSPGNFIGRAVNTEETDWYYAGTVNREAGGIRIVFYSDMETQILKSYDVLVSYSPGLSMELTDFEVVDEPLGNQGAFMGQDQITNMSPITIRQSLTHRKMVTEVHTITTNRTWTSTYTKKITIWLIFGSYTKTTVTTYTHSTSETIQTTEETEVAVTRDIVVPPFTSVQACSQVSIKESEKVRYTAKARYSAPGLSPSQVLQIIKDDGVEGAVIDGDFVVMDADGEFTATLAMNTEFYVKNMDSLENCDAMKFKIDKRNRERKALNL